MRYFRNRLKDRIGFATAISLLVALALVLTYLAAQSPSTDVAIVIAVSSAFFAALGSVTNLMLAVEAQKESRRKERPYVIANPELESGGLISLIIRNQGNSPALNTFFKFESGPVDFKGRELQQLSIFEKPISFLPPGKQLRQLIIQANKLFEGDMTTTLSYSISYESIYGEKFRETVKVDLVGFKDMNLPKKSVEEQLTALSKAVEGIAKTFDSVVGVSLEGSTQRPIWVESPEQNIYRFKRQIQSSKVSRGWKRPLISFLQRCLSVLEK